eukprot:CAMPEP_0197565640 /NCGR_PEP_ID=MMETSP1320-20131121/32503_1 /TAXON_ID=91990 /ORGANISM="Bolidomonas sp., Strain RCC2347" /LENGTH=42 /DNA_ID= /DNA_START= /DNA_END= /DNA_ORIENTATION=
MNHQNDCGMLVNGLASVASPAVVGLLNSYEPSVVLVQSPRSA